MATSSEMRQLFDAVAAMPGDVALTMFARSRPGPVDELIAWAQVSGRRVVVATIEGTTHYEVIISAGVSHRIIVFDMERAVEATEPSGLDDGGGS
jgi:hypothetical protein